MRLILVTIILLKTWIILAQSNLIPNPDFEEYYDCDYVYNIDDIKTVIPHWSAIHTSARYFNNVCYQDPISSYYNAEQYCPTIFGDGYAGAVFDPEFPGFFDSREYMQCQLLDTLHKGKDYFISYYLTIFTEDETPLSHYGINFTDTFIDEDVTPGMPFMQIILDPTIEIDTIPDLQYCQWQKFTHCFSPDSNATVMTVGIFAEQSEILGVDDIPFGLTNVAYDNYFLAEIEEEIIIDDHPDTICVGDCITLSTNHSLIEGSFEWILPGSDIGNSQDSIVTVCYQTEGIFDIAVSAEHCTGRYDSLYSDALTVVAGISYSVPDSSICAGEEIILSVPDAYSVTWHDLSTSSSITLSAADTYTYEISNGHCSIVDSFSITYHTSPSLQLVEIFACVGDSTTYIDQTYSLPGMYQDTIMDMQGCDSIYFDIVFDYFEAEPIANESPYAFCTGQSVSVDLMSSSDYAISWTDGASTMPRVFDQAGTYHYQYTDDNLCLYSDSILINALDTPSVMTMDLLDIWFDGSVDIPVQYNGNIASYLWSDASPLSCADCPYPSLVQAVEGQYTIQVTSENSCTASDVIQISFEQVQLHWPNIVAKKSAVNNTFYISSNIDINYALSIYDRWGNQVWNRQDCISNDASCGWLPELQDISSGVYVFLVEYLDNNVAKYIGGDVTVID